MILAPECLYMRKSEALFSRTDVYFVSLLASSNHSLVPHVYLSMGFCT